MAATVGFIAMTASATSADEVGPPRDVDEWHRALTGATDGDFVAPRSTAWSLGIYPSAGVALGPPNWVSYQLHAFASVTNGKSFSLFVGYGYERGPDSSSHMATMGWGGVRRLSAARPQRGFYGKFLRYRRMEDFTHGIHHGISVGTETGAGIFSMAFEIGAARSNQNHWSVTAQVVLKLAVPVLIPLSG